MGSALRLPTVLAASVLVLSILVGGAVAAAPSFMEPAGSPVPVGVQPHSVAAADFNRDGNTDLAVANYGSDNVAILRGDGAGHFAAATFVPVGDGPLGLAAADLNRDGRLDLAVANGESDDLSILLGDGAGGFAAAGPAVRLTNGPWYVSIGDVNRDHRPDIVVAHVGFSDLRVPSTDVSVLLGDGRGGFAHAPGSPITVGRVPYGVEIVDLNHDGNPDLAIANQFENYLSILLGDGTGRFSPAPGSPIVVGSGPSWLVAEDFNRDTHPDLAVAVGSGTVPVLLGDGTGRFSPAPGSPVVTGYGTHEISAADFNGDGKVDLGIDNFDRREYFVLVGDGAGGFTEAGTPAPVGPRPLSHAVGDFDNDGKPDVAVANNDAANVTILLNTTPTPAEEIAALRVEVQSSSVKQPLRFRLALKLGLAELAARAKATGVACHALASFAADVQANSGRQGLTAAQAEAWGQRANEIRTTLDC